MRILPLVLRAEQAILSRRKLRSLPAAWLVVESVCVPTIIALHRQFVFERWGGTLGTINPVLIMVKLDIYIR